MKRFDVWFKFGGFTRLYITGMFILLLVTLAGFGQAEVTMTAGVLRMAAGMSGY